MDELTKKWAVTGLLDGITDAEKTMLALNFERLALHVLAHDGDRRYDKVSMMIFPILRRISVEATYSEDLPVTTAYRYYHVNPINVLDDFTNYMNSREAQDLISDLQTYAQIDWEAEICQLYSEYFSHKFRSTPSIKPVKYVKKHRL